MKQGICDIVYAYEQFRSDVKKSIERASNRKLEENELSVPPDAKFGDLSCSIAFKLAKEKKKNPKEAATEIAKKIKPLGLIENVETAGPYINFHINWSAFNGLVLDEALKKDYGGSAYGKGKTVMIEYSQPNPNKPQHIGHLRNNLIGMAVANCLEANGYKVIKVNWINDRGVHIMKIMLGYQKWANGKKPDTKADHFVGKYYMKFVQEEEKNPKLTNEAQEMLRKWEANDKATRELWKKVVGWAYEGADETYKLLGTEFDVWFYESNIYKRGREIAKQGLQKGVFEWDKTRAIIAPLKKYGLPDKIMVRADGTTIYVTADLALNELKNKKYKLDRSLFCVGGDHETYFKQLFKIFELLGYKWAKICHHLKYGMVRVPEGKMSSRKGRVVYADDVINDVLELAKSETKKKKVAKNVERAAKQVGIGALKFAILKTDLHKDITFDKKQAVSFDGDTGPYLQYAHARSCRILEKVGNVGKADYTELKTDEEKALIKKLAEFPDVVKTAGLEYELHTLANYLLNLAHTFSAFYLACPVIRAETKELKAARVKLVKAVKNTLHIGLNLLGIDAPERM